MHLVCPGVLYIVLLRPGPATRWQPTDTDRSLVPGKLRGERGETVKGDWERYSSSMCSQYVHLACFGHAAIPVHGLGFDYPSAELSRN